VGCTERSVPNSSPSSPLSPSPSPYHAVDDAKSKCARDDDDDGDQCCPSSARGSSDGDGGGDGDGDDELGTATATTMTTRIAGGRHALTSIETFFPPSRISDMLGTITAVAFVGIAGSMGRMERGVRRVEER
jgi:hypothetical protein